MAFSKFKLSKASDRTTPVPIAAALPRPSSTQNKDYAPHENRPDLGQSHNLFAPIKSQRYRCNKRQALRSQNDECQVSRTCLAKPATGLKYHHALSTDRNKPSQHAYSPPVAPQTALLSIEADSQPPRAQCVTAFAPHEEAPEDGKTKSNGVDSSPEARISAAFLVGLAGAGNFSSQSARPRARKIDHMVDCFFNLRIAEQVFHRYTHEFASTCPIVVFSQGTTAGYVRSTKPLLFMSILSVASAGLCPLDQQKQFAYEARNLVAEIAVFQGVKSLELVQALLVISFWYRAPEDFSQMNQNQLASVALSMAIDLGLDRIEGSMAPVRADDEWDQMEAKRAWLGCFLLCASISLIMRRPNPILWTSKLDEYIDDLHASKSQVSDLFLCKVLATEQLCHAADQELSLSNPNRSMLLSNPETLQIIHDLQGRIGLLPLDQHDPLERSLIGFARFASSLYMHELALHIDHNIDEFQAPFFAKSLKSCGFIDIHTPNTTQLSMIHNIIQAAQGLLDTFIGLSTSKMLSLPPHIYAGRVIYAVILLIKVHKALSLTGSGSIESLSVDQLRLEAYLEQLVLISTRLGTEDERSSLSRAFLIMPQLQKWFNDHQSSSEYGLNDKVDRGIRAELDGSLLPATSTRAVTLKSRSADADVPARISLGYSEPLTEPQFDNPLILEGGVEKEGEALRREVASDSWFWEFFNVDMLH